MTRMSPFPRRSAENYLFSRPSSKLVKKGRKKRIRQGRKSVADLTGLGARARKRFGNLVGAKKGYFGNLAAGPGGAPEQIAHEDDFECVKDLERPVPVGVVYAQDFSRLNPESGFLQNLTFGSFGGNISHIRPTTGQGPISANLLVDS